MVPHIGFSKIDVDETWRAGGVASGREKARHGRQGKGRGEGTRTSWPSSWLVGGPGPSPLGPSGVCSQQAAPRTVTGTLASRPKDSRHSSFQAVMVLGAALRLWATSVYSLLLLLVELGIHSLSLTVAAVRKNSDRYE